MNAETLSLYEKYLDRVGDPAAAASLTLADVMQSHQTDGMLNLKEASEILGYTVHGLRDIVDRTRRSRSQSVSGPTIEFFQSSKHGTILFKREWLEDFIEKHHIREEKPAPRKKSGKPLDWAHLCQ